MDGNAAGPKFHVVGPKDSHAWREAGWQRKSSSWPALEQSVGKIAEQKSRGFVAQDHVQFDLIFLNDDSRRMIERAMSPDSDDKDKKEYCNRGFEQTMDWTEHAKI